MKSVLVIDTPDNCNECPLMSTDYARGFQEVCNASAKNFRGEAWKIKDIFDVRPDWCPLKTMPKPKPIGDIEEIIWDNDTEVGYNCGWNACLKEIEK